MKIENNPQAPVFALGEHYPANGLHKDGATAHFFSRNDDNILGIFTHIGAIEEHILKFGCVEFGLLYQNGALLLVLQFFCQIYKNLKLCFSAPFDVRGNRGFGFALPGRRRPCRDDPCCKLQRQHAARHSEDAVGLCPDLGLFQCHPRPVVRNSRRRRYFGGLVMPRCNVPDGYYGHGIDGKRHCCKHLIF